MEKLRMMLEKTTHPYEILHHDGDVSSAQGGADYFHIQIGQTAPTLIIKTDRGFFVLIVSGKHGRIDFKEVGKVLQCKKVKLASPEEIGKMGYQIGNIPLVGIPLPHILDENLFKYSFVYGGTGVKDYTLKISPCALEELNSVIAKINIQGII